MGSGGKRVTTAPTRPIAKVGGDDVADEVGPLRGGGGVDAHVGAGLRTGWADGARPALGSPESSAAGRDEGRCGDGAAVHHSRSGRGWRWGRVPLGWVARLRDSRVFCEWRMPDRDSDTSRHHPGSGAACKVWPPSSPSSRCSSRPERPRPQSRRSRRSRPAGTERRRPAAGDQRLPRQPAATVGSSGFVGTTLAGGVEYLATQIKNLEATNPDRDPRDRGGRPTSVPAR